MSDSVFRRIVLLKVASRRVAGRGDADDPRFEGEGGRRFSAQWRSGRLKELEDAEEKKKKKFKVKKSF